MLKSPIIILEANCWNMKEYNSDRRWMVTDFVSKYYTLCTWGADGAYTFIIL